MQLWCVSSLKPIHLFFRPPLHYCHIVLEAKVPETEKSNKMVRSIHTFFLLRHFKDSSVGLNYMLPVPSLHLPKTVQNRKYFSWIINVNKTSARSILSSLPCTGHLSFINNALGKIVKTTYEFLCSTFVGLLWMLSHVTYLFWLKWTVVCARSVLSVWAGVKAV